MSLIVFSQCKLLHVMQKLSIALCCVIIKQYIGYKLELHNNKFDAKKSKKRFFTSLLTIRNVCRVLSEILNVNFDQQQIPHTGQRNMNSEGNNLNSA